ncbi:MAG: MFS transporter [Burkholderiaceae bacterium]|jgi:predicted MFS family arabinose efflux permease|nr:MFS transporter [Burkholderiaceae bacterium]
MPTENTSVHARLPLGRLLALAMAGFLAIMTETLPAGLLPQIGAGLAISESMAGQMVTLYALGSVLAAIPVVAATRSMRRRPLLMAAIGTLLVFNSLTALSGHYGLTLVARFAAGMAAGVVWGLLAGYARRMVAPQLQGRALAVAGVGQPLALAAGLPLGAWLGGLFDWRGVFWALSALCLLLLAWIRLGLPDCAGQPARQRPPVARILATPGVRPVLAVLFAWILAHNILYTFIAPYLASVGWGPRVDAVLLLFGLAAMAGIWFTGLLVDCWLRALTVLSLGLFALSAVVLGLAGQSTPALLAGVAAWGLGFGGAPTLLQTALADAAGEGADVAQSMLVTVFNLAVAGGGVAGGWLLGWLGAPALPWALALLALACLDESLPAAQAFVQAGAPW